MSRIAKKINAQCIILHERPKKLSRGKTTQWKRDCQNRVQSDQMVLGTLGLEAGPQSKTSSRGPSGLSPLRSDGSRNCQLEPGSH
jgi:hypothetical protein